MEDKTMWESEDTLGLFSCIIAILTLILGYLYAFVLYSVPYEGYFLTYFFGCIATLTLGFIAIMKGSKISIPGLVIGTFYLFAVIIMIIAM